MSAKIITFLRESFLLFIVLTLIPACSTEPTSSVELQDSSMPLSSSASALELSGSGLVERSLLIAGDLWEGFSADGPFEESALTLSPNAAPPEQNFNGRLELVGEGESRQHEIVAGSGEDVEALTYLPEFDYEFVQSGSYLVPVERGLIIADHPEWNLILEPGRIWSEEGDGKASRASLPIALVVKGGNATFNGTLTFLFDGKQVSHAWYQFTQETTSSLKMDLWGLLEARYHPGIQGDEEKVRIGFTRELAERFPTKPIQSLAEDYPGVVLSRFGQGVSPAHMTYYGFVINGLNYVSDCPTRYGIYPHCEYLRATSYSIAKSLFPSLALLRLAQEYGSDVADLLVKDFVPEYASSPGDWEKVTFNHTIDMSTGNYSSLGFMEDDWGSKMDEFFGAQPYAKRIAEAFDWPNKSAPGRRWVYRTSDTFIVTRAMQNYLQSMEGGQADIFEYVVDEVYKPAKINPGTQTSMRTSDDNWQGQAEGGYGLWFIPDDMAKLVWLLNNNTGALDGVQILHPGLLAATMQKDPNDRGVDIDSQRKYNNAFWAQRYGRGDGYDCEFWVPHMMGVSGNVVAIFPNGTAYYYFSDNREFTWDAALKEADKLIPICE